MPPRDRLQVQIANGTAGEPAKVQVHQPFRVRNVDRFPGYGDQFALGDLDGPGLCHRILPTKRLPYAYKSTVQLGTGDYASRHDRR
jgi:hypothetical protein